MLENSLCSHRLFSMHESYERSVLQWLEHKTNGVLANLDKPRPRCCMLDSGGFSAWKSGKPTDIKTVAASYEKFISKAKPYFDEIWCINLDKIPAEFGRDPTEDEIKEAIRISDINYKILTDKFGPCILPVLHQGENEDRLYEVEEMTRKTSKYICVSPRNDLPEGKRRVWAQQVHFKLQPDTKTHGLATTGNRMMESVPWWSGDSASWILISAFGSMIYYWDTGTKRTYSTIAISNDGGRDRFQGNHFDSLEQPFKDQIIARIESLGFTLEEVKTNVRHRSLFSMYNLEQYASKIRAERGVKQHAVQQVLFGV